MKLNTFKHFPKDIDLALVILLTILGILFVVIPPLNETPIRIILGLPLVLFLPGYALIATLFPWKNDLDGIERVALSFGLSIAITPLLGLALNYTPFGIRLVPILIVLSVFTISMAICAWIRRGKIPERYRFAVEFRKAFDSIKTFKADTKLDKILTAVLILSIVIAISVMVTPYQLEVMLNGEVIGEESIELMHNETCETPFTFRAMRKGEDQKLEFSLYKVGEEGIYRSLHLWVDVI
jgi:uncharacterized membrane protein